MLIKRSINFDEMEYANKLMDLDNALERLDALFDMISPAMTKFELENAEYDIQRIYDFRNYIDKMLEVK